MISLIWLFLFQQPAATPLPREFDTNVVWNICITCGGNLRPTALHRARSDGIWGLSHYCARHQRDRSHRRPAHAHRPHARRPPGSARIVCGHRLGLFVAAVVIFPAFKPGDLVTGLGITSVAIGFAFKDVLQNFFAGILILWRRPFVVGDQIRTKDYEGTVEEITVRSTRLKTTMVNALSCRMATFTQTRFWSARHMISAETGSRSALAIPTRLKKRGKP